MVTNTKTEVKERNKTILQRDDVILYCNEASSSPASTTLTNPYTLMNSGGPHSGNSLGGDDCCHLKLKNPRFSEVELPLPGQQQKWDGDFLISCITLSISLSIPI